MENDIGKLITIDEKRKIKDIKPARKEQKEQKEIIVVTALGVLGAAVLANGPIDTKDKIEEKTAVEFTQEGVTDNSNTFELPTAGVADVTENISVTYEEPFAVAGVEKDIEGRGR